MRRVLETADPVYDFAYKIATAMKKIASSHIYFVSQWASGEEMDWSDVVTLLDAIIKLSRPKSQGVNEGDGEGEG